MPSKFFENTTSVVKKDNKPLLSWFDLILYINAIRLYNNLSQISCPVAFFGYNSDSAHEDVYNMASPWFEPLIEARNITPRHGIAFYMLLEDFDNFVCSLIGTESLNRIYDDNDFDHPAKYFVTDVKLPVLIYSMQDFATMFNRLVTDAKLGTVWYANGGTSYFTSTLTNQIKRSRVNI